MFFGCFIPSIIRTFLNKFLISSEFVCCSKFRALLIIGRKSKFAIFICIYVTTSLLELLLAGSCKRALCISLSIIFSGYSGLIITADQRSTDRTKMTTDREKFVPDDQFDREIGSGVRTVVL